MKSFYILWFGQLISTLGTHLSGFSLGIWVYQKNESATQFALIWVLTLLPSLALAPLAGTLVDRWNRRLVMLFSDAGAAVLTLTLLFLVLGGRLEIWHIYLVTGVSSALQAFQGPAFMAGMTQIVPAEMLARANGLVQAQEAVGSLLAPACAGFLLSIFGLEVVLGIDLLTFVFAAVTLLVIRIPDLKEEIHAGTEPLPKPAILREFKVGIDFLLARKGLLFLLLSVTIINFLVGTVTVLITPYMLSMTSVKMLGLLSSVMGVGMLLGSGMMVVWGQNKNHILLIFAGQLCASGCIVAAGITNIVWVITCWGFLFFLLQPIMGACSNTLWQLEVPLNLQGRVFSLRRMVAWSGLPIAYLASGPLADHLFEPMMAEGGAWTTRFGWLVGTGKGRGIAMMFVIMGTLSLLSAFALPLSAAWSLGDRHKKELVEAA